MPEPQEPFIGEDGKPAVMIECSGSVTYRAPAMRLFACTDHEGRWPVGVASVVVAMDEAAARALLDAELIENRLTKREPYTLREIDLTRPAAHILNTGDY